MGAILTNYNSQKEFTHLVIPLFFLLLALPFTGAAILDYRMANESINDTTGYVAPHSVDLLNDGDNTTYIYYSGSGMSVKVTYNLSLLSEIGYTITQLVFKTMDDSTGGSAPFYFSADCLSGTNQVIANLIRIYNDGTKDTGGTFNVNVTNNYCKHISFIWENFTSSRYVYASEYYVIGAESTPPVYTPSLSLLSDFVNGTVTNRTAFNFYFNGTSVNNSNVYNCDIYADTTKKASGVSLDLTTNKNLSFILPNTESYVNFTLNCYNENASSNLSALYYVDNIPSILTFSSPNGTYYNDVPLYTNFTLSDPNLYYFEWLVYQGTTLKENITHTGNLPDSYSVYNLSEVSQITGNYVWELNVYENHNPLIDVALFQEYSDTITDSKIEYSYNEKSYSITNVELSTVITTTEDHKQYFEFIPDKSVDPKEFTYYLEYSGTLEYLPDSSYQGHFVLWDIKRYVDFVCDDYVKIVKITDSKYEIKTPCTKFETTGNLNFMQWTGNFTITTPPSLSEEYLLSIDEHIVQYGKEATSLLNQINGGISMIGFIILWLGLWVFGYYAFQTGNELVAGTMLVLTIPIDVYFAYIFQESMMLATRFMGVAFSFMAAWTLGIFLLMRRNVKTKGV